MATGCVHFYYGNGKGKTTAAMGLALRALGRGLPVTVVQFLKDGASGECGPLEKLGARLIAGKAAPGFVFTMSDDQKAATKALHDDALAKARATVGGPGILVLDEAGDALSLGLLDESLLLELLQSRGETEIVLTGHQPVESLLQNADYITEMKAHRHPYEKGLPARTGIEY